MRLISILCSILLTTIITAHEQSNQYPIIPKPLNIMPTNGTCTLTKSIQILIAPTNKDTKELGGLIANFLGKS